MTPHPLVDNLDVVDRVDTFLRARAELRPRGDWYQKSPEAEGGCGVTGFACTVPVRGKHIYEPSIQMRNRGNGKGGGIAACGLAPEDLGVSRDVLEESYILQVSLLDPAAREQVEKKYIEPYFDISHGGLIPTVDDYRDVPLLEIRPPDVARYFVRVKKDVLDRFGTQKGFSGLHEREIEDEFVFQNSVKLNDEFYASLGEKRAFVMSHARNLIIIKIVGYAEAAVQYYKMEDVRAHVWIAHQRYPTRGRVWHPGGAHPFIGMNEALVHNGDFANYVSVCEYLAQRNLFPRFLTDTEVSVMLFDLMHRVYKYPVEYIIEALAPTAELDFDRLPAARQRVYRQIQAAHMHGSPDGPWFFIIARTLGDARRFQLLGITDTAMLRPQVFALQEGKEVSVGLICSEKQAIDATLASLNSEDPRIMPVADMYWNARGGSYTDGGAFVFNIIPATAKDGEGHDGRHHLYATDKFGAPLSTWRNQVHCNLSIPPSVSIPAEEDSTAIENAIRDNDADGLFQYLQGAMADMEFDRLRTAVAELAGKTASRAPHLGIEVLTQATDRRYSTGLKKRSAVLTILRDGLEKIFGQQPLFDDPRACTERFRDGLQGSGAMDKTASLSAAMANGRAHTTPSYPCHPAAKELSVHAAREGAFRRITWDTRELLRAPQHEERTLLIDARGFAAQGATCDARLAVDAYNLGWRHLIHYNSRGTRFHAAGFGPSTEGLRIDCYDNPGDYLGSGMDGLEVYVHGNAQDQLGQIAKSGKMVIYGDVGQTFLYGAKGGAIFVMGNAAGRPLINAVGRPRVVINGTALDFLAESFMAGDPLTGGGFAIVNGIRFNNDGSVIPLDLPYAGGNLLSLASGGAIYVRDPHHTLVEEQLNGGMYVQLTAEDWKLILPHLRENERLFGIQIERDLLSVDGVIKPPEQVYTKVAPLKKIKEEKTDEVGE
jgi:glutamate synthase domain-containing protein 1/glutamate synthase domain-containing protein 3